MTDLTHRALRIQRVINGPDWPLIRDVMTRVAKNMEDAAMDCTEAAEEMRLLHIAQATRMFVRKFENALASEAGAEAE